MTKLAAALLAISAISCATRTSYSHTFDPMAVAEWRGGNADRCVFGNQNSLCLRSVVGPTGTQGIETFVVAGIRQHLPAFENRCDSADRTEVQALLGTNACIDCGTDARVPIEASAAVLAFQAGIGEVDTIHWADERGGTPEQVATRLGVAIGEFIVASARRCVPPNNGLAAGGEPPSLK